MVEAILTRKHVSGHMSPVAVVLISQEKALATIASWNTDIWTYTILSIKPLGWGHPLSVGHVASNGQLLDEG